MHNGCAPRVFLYVGSGLFAADLYPADVELCFEQVSRDGLVESVESVLSAELYEFEVVVVVKKRHTESVRYLAEHGDVFHDLGEFIRTGSQLVVEVRNRDVFATDRGVCAENAFGILHHIKVRNVSRDRNEPELFAHSLYFVSGMSVEPGELNAVISHLFELCKGGAKVCLCLLANRINLNCCRECHKNTSI